MFPIKIIDSRMILKRAEQARRLGNFINKIKIKNNK